MLIDYKQKKENVLNLFEEYKKIMGDLNEEMSAGIEFKAENIKNDKFILMVAGEAKSGKSTFINAYLGSPILPMDVKQCTSAIIEIEYGDRYKLTAKFAGGKTREFTEEKRIEEFLKSHASLAYRDIPVAAINYELLIKYKGNPSKSKIDDLIRGVKEDNLYGLSEAEYEKRIRTYIEEYKSKWKDIVTDIKIKWPLDESLKGITIIDSPGINAIGKVGEITEGYIEKANAIIFVKSLSGQALESVAFKKFLDTKAADKHRETIFLVLTGTADKSKQDLNKLLAEAKLIYNEIPKERIIGVDSKLKLILNECLEKSDEEIAEYFKIEEEKGFLFPVAENYWYKSCMKKEVFKDFMEEKSNFDEIDNVLEQFARKAQYLALQELINLIKKSYTKVIKSIEEKIELNQDALVDPKKLEEKIIMKKKEIEQIQRKMNEVIENIIIEYTNDKNGKICMALDDEMKKYSQELASGIETMEELQKSSFRKIEEFKIFRANMEKEIIEKCNDELIRITEFNDIIHSSFIEPEFCEEDFEEIKNNTENDANETREIEKGLCFKHKVPISEYSKNKHIELIRKGIVERLEEIGEVIEGALQDYTVQITKVYKEKLAVNKDKKFLEYNDLLKEEITNNERKKDIEKGKARIEIIEIELKKMRVVI